MLKHQQLVTPLALALFVGAAARAQDEAPANAEDAVPPRELILYAAPEARGDGSGTSSTNAAASRDREGFWQQRVQTQLEQGPVTVRLLPGEYLCTHRPEQGISENWGFIGLGHPRHRLTVTGGDLPKDRTSPAAGEGPWVTVFRRNPEDSREMVPANMARLMSVANCRNMTLRNLHFRGDGVFGYVLPIKSCHDILVEHCTWIDMPNIYYGASGAHRGAEDITWKNCIFVRIGYDIRAHCMYNCWSPQRLNVLDCVFLDCQGDYVRFRCGSDYGVVEGCTFISSGLFARVERPFVTVTAFNVDYPKAKQDRPLEYLGSHFRINNNVFRYAPDIQREAGVEEHFREGVYTGAFRRYAFSMYAMGGDPPGREYLMTPEQGEVLANGPTEERRRIYKEKMGLDFEQIHFYDNTLINTDTAAVFWSQAMAPEYSKGFDKVRIPITDLLNRHPPAKLWPETEEATAP